jgi:pentatricopeptide repeat protein
MRNAGLQPNLRIYSMLMSVQAKEGNVPTCLEILRQMRKEGLRPNKFVYASLMDACLAAGDPEKATELFDTAEAQGVKMDTALYTLRIRAALSPLSVAQGSSMRDLVAFARGLLETMKSQGEDCAPNVVTYNTLIAGLLDLDAPLEAADALEEMLDAGFPMDRRTNAALSGVARDQRYREHISPAYNSAVSRSAASTVTALRRVCQIAEKRPRAIAPLGSDVYLAALAAAEETADSEAAAEFVEMRRAGVFIVRPAAEDRAADAEARVGSPAATVVEDPML